MFSERNRTPSNFIILTQKWYGVFITLDLLSDLILHNKRDQEVHENFISCFLRENLIWSNLIFLDHFLMFYQMLSKLGQATVTAGSLNSQDLIKILKQSVHDFSGKRLCDGHCTEILCNVYVLRSIFNR